MQVNVNLTPEDINRTITEAVAKSAIGEALTKAVQNYVKKLGDSYNNPLDTIVAEEVNRLLCQLLRDEYQEQIKSMVRTRITEQFTDELLTQLWDIWLQKWAEVRNRR